MLSCVTLPHSDNCDFMQDEFIKCKVIKHRKPRQFLVARSVRETEIYKGIKCLYQTIGESLFHENHSKKDE